MNAWILRLILLIVTMLSPEVKNSLGALLDSLEKNAKATSNPWDDMFVAILRTLLLG